MEAPPEQKKSRFAEQASSTTSTDAPAFSLLAPYRSLAVQQRRLVHILLAALLLLLATWLAFTQPGRAIVSSTPNSSALVGLWQKIAYPFERNAFLRLPVLSSDINDVFALPGGEHVWAVGDGGLILYSPNAGRCWQQQHPVQGIPCGENSGNNGSLIAGARAADASKKVDYSEQRNVAVQQQAPVEINTRQATKTPVDRGGLPFEQQVQKPLEEQRVEKKPEPSIDSLEKGRATPPRLNAALKAVYFSDALRGWAVGEQGLVLSTVDGGQSWQAQSLGVWPLRDVVFNTEARQGWVVGIGGRILRSLDGGASWQPQNSGTRMTLLGLSLNDGAEQLCVVGQSGLVLTSTNGGQHWQMQRSGTTNTLTAVSFSNVQQGWAAGSGGTILRTLDAGLSWQAQNSTLEERLRGVSFSTDARLGRVVGENGAVLTTVDGGLSWLAQDSGSWATLLAVSFIDAEQGWVVGRDGSLLFTSDSGQSWQLQSSGVSPWLQFLVSKQDSSQQNGETTKAATLSVDDEAKHWRINNSDALEGVESLSYTRDVQRGWAVEPAGRFLITTDAGVNWVPSVEPYGRWPAPWYYAAVLFALVIAAAPLKAVAISLRNGLGIEERGQSDRPVETQLEDKLDFWPVSQALSRFLRNRHTQPPLTVAITGAWGSGKSSLMNLLKTDLSRSGVQAVWFNAWHHESEEEYLLPALLQNIRQQAIPPLLSFNGGRFYGLRFRARLLWQRLKARPVFLALLLGFLALNTGFVIVKDRTAFGPEQLALARAAFCKGSELPAIICPEKVERGEGGASSDSNDLQAVDGSSIKQAEKLDSINWFTTLINLLLGTGSGAAILSWLRAFGISPARLAKEIGSGGDRQIEQRMGYRHNFQREFNTVTDALNPRTMLILIDDLDRCQPKTVVQILEAVNFLTSAGRCYVVLGMAREMVEPAVGLAFKDIADEITHHRSGEANDGEQQKNGYAQRREFARKYLEKLINLEIPVPTVEAAQALRLLADNTSAKPTTEPWRLSNSLSTLAQGALFFALILATLWFGNVLGPYSQPEVEPAGQSAGERGVKSGEDGAIGSADQTRSVDNMQQASLPDKSADKPAEFIPGAQATVLPWLPVLVAALIFGFGSYRVMSKLRRAESEEAAAVVDDSEPFSRALRVWNPVIASQLETPRELRRFMNRLRYSAVRLNGMAADSDFENTLNEEEIVSLAALYLLDPACIELTSEVDSADEFLKHLNINQLKNQRRGEGSSPLTAAQLGALGQAIHNYSAKEGVAAWGFDKNKIDIFKVLLQGIKVH
ncbi:MAG: YCF48-related protein [Candidatus Reddybacter sp.]